MNQFTNYVELQAEKAENLSFCRGIKLLHIRDKVETMLGFIGKGGIFEEYTVHSIEHIDEMLKIVEWLIPDITKEKMTYAEWLMLTLAIYFHDLGMVVTKDEFEHRDETGFKEYKEKVLENTEEFEYEECAKERGDSFLYQEFVRENHAARIRQWIEGKNARNLGEAEAVCQEIEDILKNLDKMFKADLAMICESHHKDDIEDFSKYKVKKMYGNTENEKVNLNYIAIILRTADLLHITRDRTPSVARTLSSLIGVVCKDNFLAGVKNVICNIDMGNLLHQYALKNKEVSKIEVAHKERRIHVTYSCKNDLWYEFDLRNRGLAARSLHIPKKNMVISGLKEEIGVKNFGGIYIQSNTELCEYLIKVIGAFQSEDTEENKILLKVFLSYVFDNKVLEVAYKQDVNTSNMFKQLLEERFVHVSNELIEKMWAKIDTQEFVNKILTKNYTLYSGYNAVSGVKRCLCYTHLRRAFVDALPKDIHNSEASKPAEAILRLNQLFNIESELEALPPDQKKKERLIREKPLLEAFWSWAEKSAIGELPKSKLSKAFHYALNNREGFWNYLEDGNCSISNSLAENCIRPFVIGRKNWLFSGSPKGAEASAGIYTLVETAKANGLAPIKYIKYILSDMPGSAFLEHPEYLDDYLPWNPLVKEFCR